MSSKHRDGKQGEYTLHHASLLGFVLGQGAVHWLRTERCAYDRVTVLFGDLVLHRSGVHFLWKRSALKVWELLLWGFAPSALGMKRLDGDLVLALSWVCWEYFDKSGILLNLICSIYVFKALCLFLAVYPMTLPGKLKIVLMKISFKIQFPLPEPHPEPHQFPLTLAAVIGIVLWRNSFNSQFKAH